MNINQVLTFAPMVLIGTLAFIVAYRHSRPQKCAVCGMLTKERYCDFHNPQENIPREDIALCRNHLLQRWKNDLLSSGL